MNDSKLKKIKEEILEIYEDGKRQSPYGDAASCMVMKYLDSLQKIMDLGLDEGDLEGLYAYLDELGVDSQADVRTFEEEEKVDDISEVVKEGMKSSKLSDPFYLYTKQIKYPLLRQEEELLVARKVAQGDGPSRDDLMLSNLRLVIALTKKYSLSGVDKMDLIQEGNLGLKKAIDKFDYAKGFRFSTYATWWVRQSITRAISDQSRTIRVPIHITDQLNRLKAAEASFVHEHSRMPTDQELADKLEITIDRLKSIRSMAIEVVSIDKPVGEEETSGMVDFIVDESIPTAGDLLLEQSFDVVMDRALETLPVLEQHVLRLRYGLQPYKANPHTVEQTARTLGLTKERVRIIESRAVKKLARPSRMELLAPCKEWLAQLEEL